MISNNNQNQIKTTNNTISDELNNTSTIIINDLDEVKAFLNCNDLQEGSQVVLSYEKGSTNATISSVSLINGSFTAATLFVCSTYTPSNSSTTYTITSIRDRAFDGCTTSLEYIAIPSTVTSIGDNAFYARANLIYADFGENSQLKSIGENAFYGCESLSSIEIPENVSSIGEGAFGGCDELSSIYLNWTTNISDVTDWSGINSAPSSATIYIPFGYGTEYSKYITGNIEVVHPVINELYTASASAFFNEAVDGTVSYHFDNDYNVIIDSVSGLSDATSLSLNENLNWNDLESYYTSATTSELVGIGASAFEYCTSLEKISIPSSITSIGEFAFLDCSNLTSINIPNSVSSIGKGAFMNCASLKSINIPENVTSIGEYAFDGEYTTDITLNWTSFDGLDLDPNWISNKSSSVIIHVSEELESTYYENRVALGINGCIINNYTPEPTLEPSSNSNIWLAVGLGVGLCVPAVGGVGFGIYYGVKNKEK